MLLKLGCTVDVVSNGREALALVKIYDLILLDIGLPDISGIEVAVQAQKQDPAPRIIALTAHIGAEFEADCLAAGIEQVIAKPIDLQRLKILVYPTKPLTR